jgi:transposase-like protein
MEGMMTKRSRRKFTAQEKVAILRKHFLEGRAVSDVCDAYDLNPTQFIVDPEFETVD